MTGKTLRQLVLAALFAALVAVATMVINIPIVAVQGFLNVGDTMIFVAGIFMGPAVGFLAGGIGSALADILLGYAQWAPWTLMVKGVEGLVVGAIAHKHFKKHRRIGATTLVAMLAAAAWMVLGYYIAASIMLGVPAALAAVPSDTMQGLGSIILALPVIHGFRKVKLIGEE